MLTDTLIKNIKLNKDKAFTLRDIQGFSLYIFTTGTKSWHFKFTFQRKVQRISLGTYPDVSLKEFRILCEQHHLNLKKGLLSAGQRQKKQYREDLLTRQQNEMTFAEFSWYWKAFKLKKLTNDSGKLQSTEIQIDPYLDKDLLPRLGHLPLTKIK